MWKHLLFHADRLLTNGLQFGLQIYKIFLIYSLIVKLFVYLVHCATVTRRVIVDSSAPLVPLILQQNTIAVNCRSI